MISFLSTLSITAIVTTWIVFASIIYLWHYFIEVVLDLPVLGQSPCSAHAGLKLLIQRIIQEAIGLPTLEKNDTEIEMRNGDVSNHAYEDLLATAILNKVVENYQDDLSVARANSVSSRTSNSPFCRNEKEYFFSSGTPISKWRNGISSPPECDAVSVSSLEDWVRSDSSVGSTKYVDSVNFKIQHRIDEVSSTDDEVHVKPIIQSSPLLENDWQENWLMQKRPIGRNSSPVPVPMLVPNPSTGAKVLIGDRDADDTTDLSDAGSDFGEAESCHSIEQILTSSRNVIGGKNILVTTDVTQNLGFEVDDKDPAFVTGKEDGSFMSFESQTEQDTEYTEKYATLPRTILKSPTPNVGSLNQNQDVAQTDSDDEPDGEIHNEVTPRQNGYHHEDNNMVNVGEVDTADIFEGNYSKREKEKWNNAVEMKNNPYSSENLKRRLSDRSINSISSLFTKDSYAREPTSSSTINKTVRNSEDSPEAKTVRKKELSPVTQIHLYKALPIYIKSDDIPEMDHSSLEITSPVPSSDSDLSIERIYNLSSGNVIVNEKSNRLSTGYLSHAPLRDETNEQESIEKCMEFSLEFSTDESLHDNTSRVDNQSLPLDPEITNLCDKHLVKDILGRFSKSYPNLSSSMKKDLESKHHPAEEPPVSKRDLSKQVYSLTARSIPREFREELKKKDKAPRSSSSSDILLEVPPDEITPFPVAKSKIKFFESLKS